MSGQDSSVKKGLAISLALILVFTFGYFIGSTNHIQIHNTGVQTAQPAQSVTPAATPATPVTPAAPETPATPAAPETPATPAAPETPATPAAPETPAAPADTTPAPTEAPSSGAPTSKADIIKLYNESANKIKSGKATVTRNWEDLQHNEEKLVAPGPLAAIGRPLINTFLKKDETPLVWSTKEDIIGNYPVKGATYVSNATEADVAEATCTDDGTYYNIKLKFKESVDPTTNGVASAFTTIKPEEVKENASVVQDFSVTYSDATIEAKIEKSTGNMVHALYTLPSVLSVTARVITNIDAQVGMTFITDYSITY